MPWCPKCKSEYRDGFSVCSDCGSVLVDEEQFQKLTAPQQDLASQYLQAEDYGTDADGEEGSGGELNFSRRKAAAGSVYRDSSEKASENRSSAWVLLIVGSLGIAAIILGIFNIIPLKFGNAYLGYGVMAAIFILFWVSGIVSMKNARIFKKKAESENSLRDTMLEWCRENLHGEELDRQIRVEGNIPETEEIWYFRRFDCIKDKLNYKFVNLDQDFLDRFIDDYVYELVYGSEK